jgi:hypothetical protein
MDTTKVPPGVDADLWNNYMTPEMKLEYLKASKK